MTDGWAWYLLWFLIGAQAEFMMAQSGWGKVLIAKVRTRAHQAFSKSDH